MSLTYGALAERVAGLASALHSCVQPGDRILLLDQNSYRAIEVHYLAAALDAILVPINTRLAGAEIAGIVEQTEPSLIFASDGFAKVVPDGISTVLWPTDDPPKAENDYERLIRPAAPLFPRGSSVDGIAQIFYTSGTSGQSKGVCLTHGNLAASAYDAIIALSLHRDDVWLHAAPMFHLVDAFAIWAITMLGARHVVSHFAPATFADVVSTEQVTKTSLPPTLIAMACDSIRDGDERVESLTRVSYGGSPMSPSLFERASRLLRADLVQAYGVTEGSGIVTHETPHHPGKAAFGSAGRPTSSVELRIIGADGSICSTDAVGEVELAGPRVMAGYWRNPFDMIPQAATDGWYRTGDLARRDADGNIFIVGRKKDMIITGGENVYPTEVENALASHPAIATAAVFGVSSTRWGEEVRAAVVLREGHVAQPSELIAFCRERIGGYKVPKSIAIRTDLPMTGPGKIAKHVLRAEYEQEAGAVTR